MKTTTARQRRQATHYPGDADLLLLLEGSVLRVAQGRRLIASRLVVVHRPTVHRLKSSLHRRQESKRTSRWLSAEIPDPLTPLRSCAAVPKTSSDACSFATSWESSELCARLAARRACGFVRCLQSEKQRGKPGGAARKHREVMSLGSYCMRRYKRVSGCVKPSFKIVSSKVLLN